MRFAALLAAIAIVGAATADAGTTARSDGYRIVLGSDRDGERRAYSVRADGTRLAPILPRGRNLAPAALSRDGAMIAYYRDRDSAIYVSRANGTGLHRVVANANGVVRFSPDAKQLAFTTGYPTHIAVVGTDGRGRRALTSGRDDEYPDWSPGGKAFVFLAEGVELNGTIVVQPLQGRPRVLVRDTGLGAPSWSPDGRWIAYERYIGDSRRNGIYVVRPDGKGRHRVVRGSVWASAWSRDGKRLTYAFGYAPTDIATVGADGRGRKRLGLRLPSTVGALDWSPDGRLLAFESPWEPKGKIWVVRPDGRGLRRVASAGGNDLVGWTRLAPRLRPTRPLLPSERVLGAGTLMTRRPVARLSADGPRVAVLVAASGADCDHIAVWKPAARSIRRFHKPAQCREPRQDPQTVALAGTRAAWLISSGANYNYTNVFTATLTRRKPILVGEGAERNGGTEAEPPIGDTGLLAFTLQHTCSTDSLDDPCPPGRESGDVVDAQVWGIGGRRPCPAESGARACVLIAKAKSELTLLAVDARRVAIRTESSVRVLTASGRVVRDLSEASGAEAAALSGNRLAVEDDGIEVYDLASGRRVAAFPGASGLRDLDGDVLVTVVGRKITLRKLSTGRARTIAPRRGRVFAELERAGLYYSYGSADGGGRVVFVPRSKVERWLGGSAG